MLKKPVTRPFIASLMGLVVFSCVVDCRQYLQQLSTLILCTYWPMIVSEDWVSTNLVVLAGVASD